MDPRSPVRYWSVDVVQSLLQETGFRVHRHPMVHVLPYLAIVVGVPAGSIKFEGEENVATFADRGESGKLNRRFCKKCGSPIVSIVEMIPDLTFIEAGTLDDKSWLRPTMHVCCDSAQPWVQIPAGMSCFPKNPV